MFRGCWVLKKCPLWWLHRLLLSFRLEKYFLIFWLFVAVGHCIWQKLKIDTGIALSGSEMLCGLRSSSDIFRHVLLLSLWSSLLWGPLLGKICKLEIMIYWSLNDQSNNSSSLVRKILWNFGGKYWKRRSFVMIVNSGMLTMKTDEIGAAIWA